MKFLTYNPEQAYLLPPSVREVLGEDHICFFVHQVVDRLELSAFGGRRPPGLSSGAVAEGVAVCLRAGRDLGPPSGTAGAGGPGVPLSGGRSGAGLLDAEPVSDAARPCPERSVHTGGGVGAVAGNGAAGTRGHGLDAGGGQRLAGPGGDGGQVAGRASQNSAADSSLAETM